MNNFCDALVSRAEGAGIPPEHDYYGWLLGEWDFDWYYGRGTAAERKIPGEWLFAWIIEGKVLQDVFICPSREVRKSLPLLPAEAEYGTALRVYQEKKQAWTVVYTNGQGVSHFSVEKDNDGNIIQERVRPDLIMRWMFSEITRDSFHWTSQFSRDQGQTWNMVAELFARRRA